MSKGGVIPWNDGYLAMAHGRAGDLERARREIELMEERARTGYVAPMGFARAYLGLGDMDRCFEWLERAYAERDSGTAETMVDPLFISLHDDPRWPAFLRKMRLAG